MNKVLRMFTWLLLIFITSCAISKKENDHIDKILDLQSKSVESPAADAVTQEILLKYEIRAKQKLEDFYDYALLLCNRNYNGKMADEIRYSAQGLFYDPDAEISPLGEENAITKTVEKYLLHLQEEPITKVLSLSNIEIAEHLTREDKDYFKGKILFKMTIGVESNFKTMDKTATFSLRKIEKKAGNETVRIWEVFLETIQ